MTTAKIFKPGTQQSLIETARKTPPIKIGKHLIKIEPEDFNEFYAEKARIELNETPETVKRGLEELRTLLRGNNFFSNLKNIFFSFSIFFLFLLLIF